MTIETRKDDKLIYQQDPDVVAEPALLVQPYYGCIAIQQEDRCININYSTVKELCKVLKSIQEPK